jgi:hypothetical protein
MALAGTGHLFKTGLSLKHNLMGADRLRTYIRIVHGRCR